MSTHKPYILTSRTVFLLALAAGLCVASIYYSQPMLGILSQQFHASVTDTGLIPTLTQTGYALGILFLAPLGDRYDRRVIILLKGLLLAATLLVCSFINTLPMLLVISLAIGLTATVTQDIIPASAALASETRRGRTVGTVMTGLLAGILLSRVVSGFVAEYLGWRTVYAVAAAAVLVITLVLWRILPRFTPGTRLRYPALLLSLGQLWLTWSALRRAALAQGLLSVAFSAFWSTLAMMLSETWHLGSAVAGSFGLAGAAGALAAPIAGSLSDRRGPNHVTRVGSAIVMISFALMFCLPLLSPHGQLAVIVISAVGFDLGIQATLVAHQTIIYSLNPDARSRLNAIMFTVVFIGMSVGAVLGSKALALAGWPGVVTLATLAGAGSLLIRLFTTDDRNRLAEEAS
ncbi:MFS transporter [Paramixta manurensis]|uniref:MFS transporter n=1 Tax=Paramixta manurensis TaxID=2740817 RepID=A0A6M8UD47_9GAMM|nr:MFS transporter [Erwiniaceae bacterium PD-1]